MGRLPGQNNGGVMQRLREFRQTDISRNFNLTIIFSNNPPVLASQPFRVKSKEAGPKPLSSK